VGPITALATDVFLGDPKRFSDGKALASYIGIIPRERSSGGRQRVGGLSKPPASDPRTPDILVTPNIATTYSGSTKKLAEHGGFAPDDDNVMLLSNPGFEPKTITIPVETLQIAPTILKPLGLDPNQLQAVQKEHTQVRPSVPLDFGDNW